MAGRADRIDLLAAQWEAAPNRRPLAARDVGLTLDRARGREGYALFHLLAAAAILEADAAFPLKLALIRDLDAARAFENVYERDWTLDRVLEAIGALDGSREAGAPEERLVHLPRIKRALKETLAALAAGGGAGGAGGDRTEALRRAAGYAIAGGAFWVEREMRRLGLW